MADQNHPLQQTIAEIEQQYAGRTTYKSRREKYQDTWTGGTNKALTHPEKPKVPLLYDQAKAAIIAIMSAKVKAENKQLYIYAANKPKAANILHVTIGSTDGDYNPCTGIYLYGSYSSGKTWIMRCQYELLRQAYYSFRFDNVTAAPYWCSYKTDIMMRARKEKDISFLDEMFRGKAVIYIDDIGYEEDSQLVLWGNRENIIVHLVDILHRHYLSGAIIYFTSNLQLRSSNPSIPNIYDRYGQGTHDRLAEMTTPVLWGGDKNLRTGKTL